MSKLRMLLLSGPYLKQLMFCYEFLFYEDSISFYIYFFQVSFTGKK